MKRVSSFPPGLCLLLLLACSSSVAAAPQTYRSRNFIVHSDIDREQAEDLLKRLERMLDIISKYWGRPNRKPIECCVVKDLGEWPAGRIPPMAIQKLKKRTGVTLSVSRRQGMMFSTKSIVYAPADVSITQHEAVHAIAAQSFGSTGPVWYSEGMAEMGRYWENEDDRAVRCERTVISYLRRSPLPSLKTLTRTGVTADSWQNYAQRWALCHLLANNDNYATRFRVIGPQLMNLKPQTSFRRAFGTMSREIEFEYHEFLRHLQRGYRVDLCVWDWKARFRRGRSGRTTKVTVAADRGWQASRLIVEAGKSYSVRASGNWKLSSDARPINADGDSSGEGRLEAVIFSQFRLTASAKLGATATFTPSQGGKLFLRCGDRWNALHDNSGKIKVSLTLLPSK